MTHSPAQQIRALLNEIERQAFLIPPPNLYTPCIVQHVQSAITALQALPALEWQEKERIELELYRLIVPEYDTAVGLALSALSAGNPEVALARLRWYRDKIMEKIKPPASKEGA